MCSYPLSIWTYLLNDVDWNATGTWALVATAIVSIKLVMCQIRKYLDIETAKILKDLLKEYISDDMRMHRSNLANDILDGRRKRSLKTMHREVLWFFESLGIIARKGGIDLEVVHGIFGDSILHFYAATKDMLKQYRIDYADPQLYSEFDWLDRKMRKYEKTLERPSPQEVEAFLKDQIKQYKQIVASASATEQQEPQQDPAAQQQEPLKDQDASKA